MSEIIQLKVSNKTELHALQDLIIATFVFFALGFIVLFYAELPYLTLILLAFYGGFYFFPVIILHSNYEKYNKNKTLILDNEKIILGNEQILLNEIKTCKATGTYQSINKTSFSKLPYQCAYFFIEIKDIKGQEMYLTNLLSKDLIEIFEKKYPDIKIEKN